MCKCMCYSAKPSKEAVLWTSKEKSFDLACYSSNRSVRGSSKCTPFFMHVSCVISSVIS